MRDTGNRRDERADDRWLWRISLSAAALFWERLWRALWPPLAIAALFFILALLDFLPHLPGWLHAILLGGFALAFALLLWMELHDLSLPGYREARRRLEQINALAHRPLEALDDSIAGGAEADPVARELWRRHQERMRETVALMRVGAARPGLIHRDPLTLRFALVLGLAIALLIAGGDAPDRLLRAVSPGIVAAGGGVPVTLDAWLTPPPYTGQPPVFLSGGGRMPAEDPVTVPQGSILVAQIGGAGAAPEFALPDGLPAPAFDPVGGTNYRAEVPLETGGRVAVLLRGKELGGWNIEIVPDAPPSAAFLREPGRTPLAALRLDFEAHDDYGLAAVSATVRRPAGTAGAADESIVFDLPLPSLNAADASGTGYQDLTAHPWAGLPVEIQLTARDGRGQRGTSGAIATVLPEREFQHPVARAIVEQRKHLAADPIGARHTVGAALRTIARDTAAFDGDVTVFLALTASSQRLRHSTAPKAPEEVMQILWDTALRLEDGKLSLAARELRRLQKDLADALSRDATDEELTRLMDRLEAALDELMDALAKMQPRDSEGMPIDPNAMAISREDLRAMFDRMRDLARGGARDAARQMLSELQSMLENLQTARPGQPSKEFQDGMKMLDSLQDMMRAQQEMLDRTYREAQRQQEGQQEGQQNGKPGGKPEGGQQGDATLQEALRRQLGELMRQMGEMGGDIPRPFGRAEGAMRRSTEALRNGQPGAAVPPQGEALDQLREGARMATEQMMQKFGMQGPGMPGGRAGMQPGQQDPFGRRTDGGQGFSQGDVDIPSESDVQRARRILDELRRRAGEHDRPAVERDYIDRLLKPY